MATKRKPMAKPRQEESPCHEGDPSKKSRKVRKTGQSEEGAASASIAKESQNDGEDRGQSQLRYQRRRHDDREVGRDDPFPGWSCPKKGPTPRSPSGPHEPTAPAPVLELDRAPQLGRGVIATRARARPQRAARSPSIAPMRGLYEALDLDIVRGIATRPRADETMFDQSSRFQPVAQLDHRRRVPLAAGRACYLASV
jgi:hypothetical protein